MLDAVHDTYKHLDGSELASKMVRNELAPLDPDYFEHAELPSNML